ncbi:tRNA3(Ser)-specific nuclease WapA precursor [compost metagenome]
MMGLSHKRNGTGLRSYSYSYDMNRNITGISENGATAKQFTYDPMNRITTSLQFNETYSYDSRGNRQTLKTESAHLMGKTVSYQYDEWDRLTKVNLANGASVEYKYNGDNLLVERKEGTVITRYYYDGQVIIAEGTVKADGSTDLKTSYLYGHSLMMSEDASDNKGYYLSNGHGDVVEICDSAGNILNQYTYNIWGNTLTASENVHNLFRYSGEYWDKSTNLQYLRARWYDPSIGRFINEDTYEGEITNPLSQNLYTYVYNNPLRYLDPSGHIPTAMEAALMAQHIYGATKTDYFKSLSGGWELNDIMTNDEGLKMGVYSRLKDDGTTEYSLVNKGTTSWGDWGNNFQQPVGFFYRHGRFN